MDYFLTLSDADLRRVIVGLKRQKKEMDRIDIASAYMESDAIGDLIFRLEHEPKTGEQGCSTLIVRMM